MAGEYDKKFEEVTELLHKTISGVDELHLEVRDLRSELRDNTTKLGSLTDKVTILSGQFNDVGVMAIKDSGRIDDHEKRISDLEENIH